MYDCERVYGSTEVCCSACHISALSYTLQHMTHGSAQVCCRVLTQYDSVRGTFWYIQEMSCAEKSKFYNLTAGYLPSGALKVNIEVAIRTLTADARQSIQKGRVTTRDDLP